MRALESMRLRLGAIGLYSLEEGTVPDCELQAYAAGLDLLHNALGELEQESFVQTAEDWGLRLFEERFGVYQPAGSLAERRKEILARSAVTDRDFTRAAIEHALTAAGLVAEICENPAENKISVNCFAEPAGGRTRAEAAEQAKKFLPAHVEAELDFRTISWNNIDENDRTFAELDALDYTWDMVDNYQSAVLQIE